MVTIAPTCGNRTFWYRTASHLSRFIKNRFSVLFDSNPWLCVWAFFSYNPEEGTASVLWIYGRLTSILKHEPILRTWKSTFLTIDPMVSSQGFSSTVVVCPHMLISRHKVFNAQAKAACSLQRTDIQGTSIIYQNNRYSFPHGIHNDIQRIVVVLPLLGQICEFLDPLKHNWINVVN